MIDTDEFVRRRLFPLEINRANLQYEIIDFKDCGIDSRQALLAVKSAQEKFEAYKRERGFKVYFQLDRDGGPTQIGTEKRGLETHEGLLLDVKSLEEFAPCPHPKEKVTKQFVGPHTFVDVCSECNKQVEPQTYVSVVK